ncbi:myosin-6-like [Hibiscus syriacus]|uniref:myosin-6-like n=1 Tax=Hibiscus syriacus TaxID=106335 RepID=UPI00192386E9|nr:myosin-6-like [Hibiscus syriacus]
MPRRAADTATTERKMHRRTNTDWSGSSASDGSLTELANSPDDIPREWHKGSDPVEKLRSENTMLLRQLEVSELELQSLRKQILKENNRTRDLSRQITSLKEERDAVKIEFEQLKSKEVCDSGSEDENEGSKALLKEIRHELEHEKELNANLRLQLQKTEDSNSNLILAVRDLNEMLEQKNIEIARLTSKIEASTSIEEARHNTDEVHMMKQTITDLNAELEFYQKHKEELEMHIEELNHENDKNQLQESMKTRNELESQVQRLEDEIKQQSEEYSESLIAINELETQVNELNKELENRTQGFEEELDAIIHAKTEQEQRAIRAEEALRTTRWKNAANAERVQEEFKELSVEMAGRLDENEKMTMKAVAEANEANEELRLLKDQTVIELDNLKHQLGLKEEQIANMSMELDDKTSKLQHAQKQEKENQEAFSKEIRMLKTEIEKLEEQRNQFSDQAKQSDETRKMQTSNEKTEILIQRWNKERDELERKIASAKKETEKAQKQLISTRSLKDKKEMVISNLQSEMDNIRVECNDLKHSLLQEEREKEQLRKQLSQLRNDLQKKEDEISSIAVPVESDATNLTGLLSEAEGLKERNKAMERELKDMEERYSEISLRFAEVEGERQQLVMTVRNLKNGKKN